MKVFTRDYRITGDYPDNFSRYFGTMRPCVFDIETTGLDPRSSKVCLTAMLTGTETGVRITQFLAENHYEENRVIQATLEFFEREGIDYLITFNGQAFDVPFMNRRIEASFMEGQVRLFDFDLYRFLNKGTGLRRRLSSLSQKSIENYYGIIDDRQDTITGRESVLLFDEYAVTGNPVAEKIILTHNREDVLHLHRLMFLALADREIDDFDDAIGRTGFPVMGGMFSARTHLSRSKRTLQIRGDQFCNAVNASFFPDIDCPITAIFSAATSSYEIDVPVECFKKARPAHSDGSSAYYLDAQAAGIETADDPDCVNGYLILNSRTINVAAAKITEKIITEKIFI